MSREQRIHLRKNIQVNVELNFLEDAPHTAHTRDISEGGLYIVVDNPERYPLGELVNLHFNNPLDGDTRTEKDAVIVRTESGGIAVAFIEMGD